MPVPTLITSLSETASSNSPPGSETVGTQMNDYIQAAYAFIAALYHGKWAPTIDINVNTHKITNLVAGVAGTDAVNVTQNNTTLGAPSGTRVVFQQAAAPLGWAVDGSAYLQDAAMRFSAGAGAGGSVGWSSWMFGGSFTTDGHAVTWGEMPVHTHGDFGHTHGVNDPGHGHGVSDPGHVHAMQQSVPITGSGFPRGFVASGADIAGYAVPTMNAVGTGIGIAGAGTGVYLSTGYANLANAGSSAAHSHTFHGPQTKYADCVVCVKS